MLIIKTVLAGLLFTSLCLANISGIVTDTGSTPIPGAIVQLEKGGQTATTGTDGKFTLVTGSTGTLPVHGRLFPSSLSARISGNLLHVTITERSAVEVAAFDLTGKALSTMHNNWDAGIHSITLPQRGAGIYLYKVKSGNSEVVLKGNSAGGVSSVSVVSNQGLSLNFLAKQSKTMAEINDVIAATKTGYLNYRCVQYNADTTGVQIKMIASAGTVTDTDGNVYQTVKIGNQVWMTENLRVTKYNDGSSIQKVTDSLSWYNIYNNNLTTPAFCYYNNTSNADSIKKYGAFYNWYTVDTKKLAPAGWHVPTDSEWTIMEKYLVLNGFNWDGTKDTSKTNMIAQSLATKTDWDIQNIIGFIGHDLTRNNRSGFTALGGGSRFYSGAFSNLNKFGYWWSTTGSNTSDAWHRFLLCANGSLQRDQFKKSCGLSVRLVKDN